MSMAKINCSTPPPLDMLTCDTLVFDIEAWLLRPPRLPTFPYFMLVAIEAGNFLRGLLLLLAYPFILCLPGRSTRVKVMAFITFIGLREAEVVRVCRTVLPKFLLEATAMEGLEAVVHAVAAARRETMTEKKKVEAICSELPAIMVEAFLREYLCIDIDVVLGWEVCVVWGRYVGIVNDHRSSPCTCLPGTTLTINETGDDGHRPVTVDLLVGEGSRTIHYPRRQPWKYRYTVTEPEKAAWRLLPREKYPKPLVFHDGRLAFLPTPSAAIAMYTFLPLGFVLAIIRGIIFTLLPYRLALPLTALTGMHSRLVVINQAFSPTRAAAPKKRMITGGGHLFACNHRTLLDPIAVSCAIDAPVTAVTYGLSRFSEVISPIRTARLTRDRNEDRRRMAALLADGDHVVVCPEGTTCREPYLLRFSPLFAGLASEVTPVALDTRVDVFYGTSTKPSAKWLDAVYFLMNMRPEYRVEILETVVTGGGDGRRIAVANAVQRMIGEALGYALTGVTRKDKYEMMAEYGTEPWIDKVWRRKLDLDLLHTFGRSKPCNPVGIVCTCLF